MPPVYVNLRHVPHLVLGSDRPETKEGCEPAHRLRYRAKRHRNLPHIVKFSGGRSSGMLLFTLLENKLLDPDRGDVIVFNNTAAEHPGTYQFVSRCNEAAEQYGIPFFWVEFQTYEDARNGEWTRLPAYRLVSDTPRSDRNPDGFHWRGEVFEELLSWSGYVPNQFSRICTANMKLETTRMFLADWLSGNSSIPRLGHYGDQSRMDVDSMHQRHLRNRGAVPRNIFARKKEFVLSRCHFRPEQRYSDFSSEWLPASSRRRQGLADGTGSGAVREFVAFVGLRGDEQIRVQRVNARNAGASSSGIPGEHIYMPLFDMKLTREDVNAFWDRQQWDLALPQEGSLSNCVFCFLKGAANLRTVRNHMEEEKHASVPGFGSLLDSPSDVCWWSRMEKKYGRDLKAERREIRGNPKNTVIGFFGANTDFSYNKLSGVDGVELARYSASLLPCDCTE